MVFYFLFFVVVLSNCIEIIFFLIGSYTNCVETIFFIFLFGSFTKLSFVTHKVNDFFFIFDFILENIKKLNIIKFLQIFIYF